MRTENDYDRDVFNDDLGTVLRIEVEMFRVPFEVTYRVERVGRNPLGVRMNGRDLPFARLENFYRLGAAELPIGSVLDRITEGVNRLSIQTA